MSDRGIALIVLACVFASALLGLTLRSVLPKHHVGDDTERIVTLGIGLIGTLTALVLGLLVSSADESFRRVGSELTNVSVKVVELDRMLRAYGPEAAAERRAVSPRHLNKRLYVAREGIPATSTEEASLDSDLHYSASPSVWRFP
jgi:hypothetical protein